MISQKARYALRALIALARTDSMMIAEIAQQQQIPRKFLEQILLDLKHHGIGKPQGAAGRLWAFDAAGPDHFWPNPSNRGRPDCTPAMP